jgi:hypothetical protein
MINLSKETAEKCYSYIPVIDTLKTNDLMIYSIKIQELGRINELIFNELTENIPGGKLGNPPSVSGRMEYVIRYEFGTSTNERLLSAGLRTFNTLRNAIVHSDPKIRELYEAAQIDYLKSIKTLAESIKYFSKLDIPGSVSVIYREPTKNENDIPQGVSTTSPTRTPPVGGKRNNNAVKKEFIKWMQNQEKKGKSTANQYASSVNTISQHYSEQNNKSIDLYAIDDISVIDALVKDYGISGKYEEIGENGLGKSGHGAVRNAIAAYSRFLKDKGTVNTQAPSTGPDTTDKTSTKDFTRYTFNGITYTKNRLVLAVVKDYAEKHLDYSFDRLLTVFPQELQGGRDGVISRYDDVMIKYKGKKDKRHFVQKNEVVKLNNGERVVVSTEWGAGTIANIGKFIDHARRALGYTIE